MPERSRITGVKSYALTAILQVPCGMTRRDATESDSSLFEPSAEARGEQDLPVNRSLGISLRPDRFGKRADVRRERAFRHSREDHMAIDDALHDGLLSHSGAGERSQDYVYLAQSIQS